MYDIAIVGTGPTGIYTAKYLLESNHSLRITMFESQSEAGKGTPYHQDWNTEEMLANIASIEIPPITQTLVEWLEGLNDLELINMGLLRSDIDERRFYPRIVLGEYFKSELKNLEELAARKGISLTIRSNCRVTDAEIGDEITLTLETAINVKKISFTHVIMAIGHTWPKKSEIRPGYFISPWPPSQLGTIGNCNVGILGTSLSAIDAVSALAVARGAFRRDVNGVLKYLAEPGTENFKISLMSRKGLLPEADFYFPIPYRPLEICTEQAIDKVINRYKGEDLLDKAFVLFKSEMVKSDPEYAAKTGLAGMSVEEFGKEYFREREASDSFIWAKSNLQEARENQQRQHVVEWRYAILRMHEVIARIVPHLSAEDHQRFTRYLKNIFVDDYATVPHESIERLLALREEGKIEIIALGEDYHLDTETAESGAILQHHGKTIHYPAFIDATGQRPLSAQNFPFPTLWEQGAIKNAKLNYQNIFSQKSRKAYRVGGIALDKVFRPLSNSTYAERLYCPSIPFMLGQFPFIQGVTSSHDIGKTIAANIIAEVNISRAEELQAAGG